MDVFQLVSFDDHFQAHLDPGWNAREKPDVPVWGLAYNLFQLAVPVAHPGDLLAGFIKWLENQNGAFLAVIPLRSPAK